MASLAQHAGRARRLHALLSRTGTLLLGPPLPPLPRSAGAELAAAHTDTSFALPHSRRTVHNATATSAHPQSNVMPPRSAPFRGVTSSSASGTAEESQAQGHGRGDSGPSQAGSESPPQEHRSRAPEESGHSLGQRDTGHEATFTNKSTNRNNSNNSSTSSSNRDSAQGHGSKGGQPGRQRGPPGRERRQAGSLKDALRALYKRVHPDLFHSHPHQQAVNQRSFQLLQDYLATANATSPQSPHSGSSALGAAGTAYAFEFYLWQRRGGEGVSEEGVRGERAEGEELAEGKDGAAGPSQRGGNLVSGGLNLREGAGDSPSEESLFAHVRVTLPRPQRGFSPLSSSLPGLSLPTRAALSRLLLACGVDADFDWHSGAGEGAGLGGREGDAALGRGKGSLSALFQYAAELQQRASAGAWTGSPSSGASEFSEPEEVGGPAGIGRGGGGGYPEVGLGGETEFRDGLRQEVVLRSALRRAHGVSVRFASPSIPPSPAAEEQKRAAADEHRGTGSQGSSRSTEGCGSGEGPGSPRSHPPTQPALAKRLGALQSLVRLLEAHPRYALLLRGSSVLLGAPRGAVDPKGNIELPGLGSDGGQQWERWLQEQDRATVLDPQARTLASSEGSSENADGGSQRHRQESASTGQGGQSLAQASGNAVGPQADSPLLQELRSKRSQAQRILWVERVAAEEMEVDMVFADPATSAKEGYMGLLLRLIEWAEEQGSVGQGRFADLPLRVFCPDEAHDLRPPGQGNLLWPQAGPGSAASGTGPGSAASGTGAGSGAREGGGGHMEGARGGLNLGRHYGTAPFAVHVGMGYVAVPLAAEPKEVYAFISAFGHRALEAKRRKREGEERMAQLLQQCRAQLRLRRLAVDWARVEPDQAQTAMIRLLRSSQALAPLTEGVSLCLSNRTCLPYERSPGGSVEVHEGNDAFQEYLHLEWNFDLSSL